MKPGLAGYSPKKSIYLPKKLPSQEESSIPNSNHLFSGAMETSHVKYPNWPGVAW